MSNKIVEMYTRGVAVHDIMEATGLKQYQVYRVLKENGIPGRRPNRAKRTDCEDIVLEMIDRGMQYKDIAEGVGASISLVQSIAKDHDVHRGCPWKTDEETERKILELYSQGFGKRTIAKALGISSTPIERIAREHGITREATHLFSAEEVQERVGDNWIYVSGYEGFNSNIVLKCPLCGKERRITRPTALYGNNPPCSCVREKKEAEEEIQKVLDFWSELQKPRPLKRDIVISSCKICGRPFVKEGTSVYCSEGCARKGRRIKEQKKNDKRMRRMSESEVDDITLEDLIERDGGICWLCGKPVDERDFFYREDGTFMAGEDYPSVDHVVPLAKGGSHTWTNVRLAHRRCNALKGDSIIPLVKKNE